MRFRYFDPTQQSTVEGELSAGAEVAELVALVTQLRGDCSPALELTGRDGSSLVLGIANDRAVVLWTSAEGTTSHSIGGSPDERVVFDYFGAFTQVPGNYTVSLATAVVAAGSYVDGYGRSGATPSLPLVID
ncbi:MAG: Imm1 family immunity protein [Jatrophihabitans sp.]|uniref:Imm1 family immunity protein n=1 Tax=Jatrophihabitans sp. TaxID=1932789 RepID=UPI003912BA44